MKVLEFTAYGTIDGKRGFSRNQSGYGYMTVDIAVAIAASNVCVDMLTQSYFTGGFAHRGVSIRKRRFADVMRHARLVDLSNGIRRARAARNRGLFYKLRVLMYSVSMGYARHILHTGDYDVVHIHGISDYTVPMLSLCQELQVRFVVTLHGLYSFEDNPDRIDPTNLEKRFLQFANESRSPVTVISTGVRRRILEFLGVTSSENFIVIPNAVGGFDESVHAQGLTSVDGGSSDEKTTGIVVGNICERKNQVQVVRALALLPKGDLEKLLVVFAGRETEAGRFESYIRGLGVSASAKYIGHVARRSIGDLYRLGDFTIVASKSEGFGLSSIEGFQFGLPTVIFSDLDAFPDIRDDDSVVPVYGRSDQDLADGLKRALKRSWNATRIRDHGAKFSMNAMGEHYKYVMTKAIDAVIL